MCSRPSWDVSQHKSWLPTEASTKKTEPVRARTNFLAWLGIYSFLLTISSAAITAIPLPFYIICLLTILLHVPKCLFLSRMAWKDLEQWRIQRWIRRIRHHVKEIIRCKGGNEYIKGNEKPTDRVIKRRRPICVS